MRFRKKSRKSSDKSDDGMFDVVSVNSQTQIDRQKAGMNGDEPLLSGYGFVSKEITDEDLLQAWHEVLKKWHQNLTQKPKQVHHLVKKGIPEALRFPNEDVIQRDINRTFPAHDFFKETGGLGQDSLYRISKAYSVYDEEIGYVQGISFVAASLLLHDHIPDLFEHFTEMGLEIHMFASQWFLTLFTAKFPLHLVFHILDMFLSEGSTFLMGVAVALLKVRFLGSN
ncbi:GAPCENA [Mytilus edulis]|uniref:RABGAP1 n=1 Tax=Mytilus edulis TaxID=6550 RepID=A0A8S3R3N2_MYTED|nr:GAPCENA [Mytilus edulis]